MVYAYKRKLENDMMMMMRCFESIFPWNSMIIHKIQEKRRVFFINFLLRMVKSLKQPYFIACANKNTKQLSIDFVNVVVVVGSSSFSVISLHLLIFMSSICSLCRYILSTLQHNIQCTEAISMRSLIQMWIEDEDETKKKKTIVEIMNI